MNNEKTIFVFYTLKNSGNWNYPDLPEGWRWVGSGSTTAINKQQLKKYQSEEQFNGDIKTQKKTREYLDKVFKKLKNDGIVKIYKIRNSYLP